MNLSVKLCKDITYPNKSSFWIPRPQNMLWVLWVLYPLLRDCGYTCSACERNFCAEIFWGGMNSSFPVWRMNGTQGRLYSRLKWSVGFVCKLFAHVTGLWTICGFAKTACSRQILGHFFFSRFTLLYPTHFVPNLNSRSRERHRMW